MLKNFPQPSLDSPELRMNSASNVKPTLYSPAAPKRGFKFTFFLETLAPVTYQSWLPRGGRHPLPGSVASKFGKY